MRRCGSKLQRAVLHDERVVLQPWIMIVPREVRAGGSLADGRLSAMGTDYPEHLLAREPAPPFAGEEPFALWHISEDPSLGRFRPHRPTTTRRRLRWCGRSTPAIRRPFGSHEIARGAVSGQLRAPLDDRNASLARAPRTGSCDRSRLAERMQVCRLYAYQLPAEHFRPHAVGGYWVTETRWRRSIGCHR